MTRPALSIIDSVQEQFRPIDEAAKSLGPVLLKAADNTLHSGVWNGTCWAYANSPHHAIDRPIVAYRPKQKGRTHG